jgi:hypothetical protein
MTRRVIRDARLPDLLCYPIKYANYGVNSGVKLWLALFVKKIG